MTCVVSLSTGIGLQTTCYFECFYNAMNKEEYLSIHDCLCIIQPNGVWKLVLNHGNGTFINIVPQFRCQVLYS